MKPRERQKRVIFPSLTWGGGGGLGFPFILSKIAILDKIKWNRKPPSPSNQGWSRAKGKNASFSHPWFGGGSRFSIYFVQACSLAYDCQISDTSANHLSGRVLWHILVKQTDGAKISTREVRLLNIREINYARKLVRISRETTNIGQDVSTGNT